MRSKWKIMSAMVITAVVLSVGAFAIISDDDNVSSDATPMNAGQKFVYDFNTFAYDSTHNPEFIYATYSEGLITITMDPSQNTDDLIISVSDLISGLDGYTITLDGKTVILDGSLQRTADTISVIADMAYQVQNNIESASDEGVYVLYADDMTIHNDDLVTDFSGSLNISMCMDEDTISTLQDFLEMVHLDTTGVFSLTINMTSGMTSAVGSQTEMDEMTVLEFIEALSNSDASELFGVDVGEKIDGISNGILNTDPASLTKVMSGVTYSWDVDSTTYTVALDDDFTPSTTGTGFVALLNSVIENTNATSNGWEGIQLGSMRSGDTYTFEGTLQLTYMSGGSLRTLSLPLNIDLVYPEHAVIYHVNGGSDPAPVQSPVAEGNTFTVADYSGTREGYTFRGWTDGTMFYYAGSTYTMGTSDVTLTAIWQKVSIYHNVTYDVNGGSDPEPVQAPVAEGSIFIVADYSGTKVGYTFDGWTDGTDHYAVGDIYTMGDSDVMLTAVWVSGMDLEIISVAGAGGKITPNGSTNVAYRSSQVYVMMAHNNYRVWEVKVDGVSVGAINMYVFDNVTSSHTISVTFVYSEGARTWFDPSSGYIYEEINGIIGEDGTVYTITRATSPSNEVTHTGLFTNEERGVITTVVDGVIHSVINVKATASGDTDVAQISDEQINTLLAQIFSAALQIPTDRLEISIDIADSGSSGVTSTSIVLSKDQLEILKGSNTPIAITTKTGTVELDENAIKNLASYGEGLKITIGTVDKNQLNKEQQKKVGNNTIISAEAMVGSTVIHDLGGNATVTMPYTLKSGEDPNKIEMWYLDDQGNITEIDATYDSETKTVSFVTDHFSYYVVAFGSPDTTPTSNNWIIYIAIIIVVILVLAFVVYHYKMKKTA